MFYFEPENTDKKARAFGPGKSFEASLAFGSTVKVLKGAPLG